MATLVFTTDLRTMHPGDLADKIAAALSINPPACEINGTAVTLAGAGVTEGNSTAIQSVISAYVLDPVRAKSQSPEEARLKASYLTLRQWAVDANTEVAAWDNQTAAARNAALKETINRFGKLCDGIADLLRFTSLDA